MQEFNSPIVHSVVSYLYISNKSIQKNWEKTIKSIIITTKGTLNYNIDKTQTQHENKRIITIKTASKNSKGREKRKHKSSKQTNVLKRNILKEEEEIKNNKLQKEKATSIRLLNDKSKEKQEERSIISKHKNFLTKKGKRKKGTTIGKIIFILFLILTTNIVKIITIILIIKIIISMKTTVLQ